MPTPLHFSDEEMDLLLELSRPIEPAQRSAFLDAVAAAIGEQASGPGLVHQVGRRVQRQFWTPPELSPNGPAQPSSSCRRVLTSRWRAAINLILDRIDERISKLEANP